MHLQSQYQQHLIANLCPATLAGVSPAQNPGKSRSSAVGSVGLWFESS